MVEPPAAAAAGEGAAPAAAAAAPAVSAADAERQAVLEAYRKKVREHREMEARVKAMREEVKSLVKSYNKTEDDLKALQASTLVGFHLML
jgi:hypothetical protein